MIIQRAQRKKAKLRLGLSGSAGSGKTWSSLEIATGMGGRICLIDTEGGSGDLYGENFVYDVLELGAPYSPDRYIEAIKEIEKEGYDILIIDSLSHAWVGEGGVLSIVDRAGTNKFSGWRVGTPKQNALIDTIMSCKMHIITTLRVKTEYVVEQNDRGKSEPRKIGLSPVQRDGLEYEFTMFMDMNQDHMAHVMKDRTRLYDQQYVKPTQDMGKKLVEWLNSGVDEREQFVNVKLDPILDSIRNATDKNTLRDIYSNAYRLYADKFPQEFQLITAVKDSMKDHLSPTVREVEIANTDSYQPIGISFSRSVAS